MADVAQGMAEGATVLLAGGGTGGHLYPGIAVAEALAAVCPRAKPLFLCTEREIDKVILAPTGFEFIPQPIVPPRRSIGGLLRFWRGWRETTDLVRKVLKERKPLVALGLGGYAAGVAVKQAAKAGVPSAVLNPDVIPGKANHYLMRYVSAVCCQFQRTADYLSSSDKRKVQLTGCPIRADIRTPPPRAEAARRLGLDPALNTLVVTGASLGAQTVNEGVLSMLAGMSSLRGWQVLHLSGREHAEAVRAGYREVPRGVSDAARVIDFTPAMADVWAAADLTVCRAGASTCAEVTACGVPSVLMPYPYHRDMHQRANAKELVDAGAAVLVDDEKDRRKNAAKLKQVVEPLLYDAARRRAMADAARKLGRPDAAEAVARVIMGMVPAGRSCGSPAGAGMTSDEVPNDEGMTKPQ